MLLEKPETEQKTREGRERSPDRTLTLIHDNNFNRIQEIQKELRSQGLQLDHGTLSSAAIDLATNLPNAAELIADRAIEILKAKRKRADQSPMYQS